MRLVAILVAASLIVSSLVLVNGSSQRPLPLKRLEFVNDVRLEKVDRIKRSPDSERQPRKDKRTQEDREILHSDSFRLSFRAFSNDFYLHLEPTEDLVPREGATVRYTSYDPVEKRDVVRRTETLFAHDVRAYQGVVMHSNFTSLRFSEEQVGLLHRSLPSGESMPASDAGQMGRASIILHDDGSKSGKVEFEGMFDWAGNEHVIQSPLNFHATRSEHDPYISRRAMQANRMILHRKSDRMSDKELALLQGRAYVGDEAAEEGCSADLNEYNAHNALRLPGNSQAVEDQEIQRFSSLSFFASPQPHKLGRRDQSTTISDIFRSRLLRRSGGMSFDFDFGKQLGIGRRAFDDQYSYHDALVRRQSADTLGGTNNDSYTSEIGSTSGCPTSNRVVYIGMATDCTYTARFANTSEARLAVLNDMNTVSNIFRSTFRVALGVVELEIRDPNDCPATAQGQARWNRQCSDSYALDQRLSDFSAWRADQPANGTGLWHLLTTCLSGSEAGVAWLGTLCKTDRSGSGGNVVSGTGVTASTQNEAQTIAHEIGHNFGAVHDCAQGCSVNGNLARQSARLGSAVCCPRSSNSCNSNGEFIMNPVSTGQQSQAFSPCSIGNICSMLRQGLDTSCVEDPSQSQRETLSAQQCGNGILEPGEECDAGPNGSQCCTAECRLTSGSVCDPEGSACCTDQCQFAGTSTVCRPAVDDRCDTAETCSGTSAECPADVRRDNGDSCGNNLQCAAGHCTSRDQQCQQQSTADYNFTQACPLNADNSCSVSCRDPRQVNSCAILQQNFIDGTECGYGGFCEGGECRSGSWQNRFQAWYRENLRISIPVTIVVGVIVLFILYAIVRCLCFPSSKRGKTKASSGAMLPNRSRRARNNAPAQRTSQFGPPPAHPMSAYNPSYAGQNMNGYQGDPTNVPHDARRSGNTNGWADPYSYNGPVGSNYPTH